MECLMYTEHLYIITCLLSLKVHPQLGHARAGRILGNKLRPNCFAQLKREGEYLLTADYPPGSVLGTTTTIP